MKKLVLLDIDGTLVHCGKAPRLAITQAMRAIYGTEGGVERYSFSGKTDSQIIFDVMTEASLHESVVRERLPQTLNEYVRHLNATLKAEEIEILAGVQELLDAMTAHPDVVVGLLTGNVVEGARIKLSRAGIGQFFFHDKNTVGAFGNDAMYRPELPGIAVERAFAAVGKRFLEKDIVIMGDSPYDVECGRSLNVRSIAVATGWHSAEELAAHHPDFLFADLSDTQAVMHAILL